MFFSNSFQLSVGCQTGWLMVLQHSFSIVCTILDTFLPWFKMIQGPEIWWNLSIQSSKQVWPSSARSWVNGVAWRSTVDREFSNWTFAGPFGNLHPFHSKCKLSFFQTLVDLNQQSVVLDGFPFVSSRIVVGVFCHEKYNMNIPVRKRTQPSSCCTDGRKNPSPLLLSFAFLTKWRLLGWFQVSCCKKSGRQGLAAFHGWVLWVKFADLISAISGDISLCHCWTFYHLWGQVNFSPLQFPKREIEKNRWMFWCCYFGSDHSSQTIYDSSMCLLFWLDSMGPKNDSE